MSEFKIKAKNGLLWSFIDNSSNQVIQFIIGIILARILSPREFGLIGMLTFFIAISQTFIDGGFGSALIRKKKCSQSDYSTIFFLNLILSIIFCLLLIVFSGIISRFFNEPQLKPLVNVLALGLIINAFTIIQRTELTKRLDFHLQAKISIISALFSGTIGIVLAYSGFGVWSLVARTLSGILITAILLWFWNHWKPTLEFSSKSLFELFGFGGKLLVSVTINTIFQNLYLLVIGKIYSASDLGFYTRADQFKTIPQQNLTKVVERVTFPLLSEIQDDNITLLKSYQKLLKNSMFVSFLLMFILSASSKAMVITLIGEEWIVSANYLQWLCFVGVFYPMQSLNRNLLMVKGRSDLVLRLEIIKKTLFVPIIAIGILVSIKALIISLVIYGMIETTLDSYFSGRLVKYSFVNQLRDIMPFFFIGISVGIITYLTGLIPNVSYPLLLIFQLFIAIISLVSICEIFKVTQYHYYKMIFIHKFKSLLA